MFCSCFRNPMMRFSSDLVAVYADHSLSSLEGQSMDIPIYLVKKIFHINNFNDIKLQSQHCIK